MKKLSIGKPVDIAEKIIAINGEILSHEEPLKQLKAKRDELRQTMLESLKANRMNSLETDYGISFTRAFRASLGVIDPKRAMEWALKNDCAKVDTIRAGRLLKGAGALPEGFEQKETEYLQTSGMKDAFEN